MESTNCGSERLGLKNLQVKIEKRRLSGTTFSASQKSIRTRISPHWIVRAAVLTGIVGGLGLTGCQKNSSSSTSTSPGFQITAQPNPVPASEEKSGKTTISWNVRPGTVGEVYLSVDGTPEKLFGGAVQRGRQEAEWINAGSVYEFVLYEGKDHSKALGSVKVTRLKQQ